MALLFLCHSYTTLKSPRNTTDTFDGLVGFYGISTIVGYLMPNPVFTYILNIWFINTFCKYTDEQTVLFNLNQQS